MPTPDLIELNQRESTVVKFIKEEYGHLQAGEPVHRVRVNPPGPDGISVNLDAVIDALLRNGIYVFQQPDAEIEGATLLTPLRPPQEAPHSTDRQSVV